MNLGLIGYRGTGKSTVARLLALALSGTAPGDAGVGHSAGEWHWLDADVEIELRAGKSIGAIFADEGEEHFRDLESQVVAELAGRDRCIMAVGGGAVMRAKNRAVLAATTKLIWLTASPQTIWQRTSADAATADRRPNLTCGGLAEIETLLAEREPIYRQCAAAIVDTEGKLPGAVAAEILAHPLVAPLLGMQRTQRAEHPGP